MAEKLRNILLQLAFVGTRYSGWQRQKNSQTVQQVLEETIAQVCGESVKLNGCSRTDAGVHAEQFWANFKTKSPIPADRFKPAIQSKLPRDIQILKSKVVSPDFHARRDAKEKLYRYQMFLGRSPFRNDRWWQHPSVVDLEQLAQLARLVEGCHDFSAFCVLKSLKHDNRCIVKQAAWRLRGKELYFKVVGDRFLHRMVRFLVGAQIEVLEGRLSEKEFRELIMSPQGKRALFPAPPEGLYLAKVRY